MTYKRLNQLITVSYPAGLESFIFQFGMLSFFWIVALYGTNAVAAYNIGVNVLMVSFTVGNGFAIAGATLTGQHLGAADPDKAYESGVRAAALTVFSMGTLGILLAIFSRELASFFIDDVDVVNKAVIFLIGRLLVLFTLPVSKLCHLGNDTLLELYKFKYVSGIPLG